MVCFYESIKHATFVCDVCGHIVFPTVKFEDGITHVIKESSDLRGGKGKKVIKENVCNDCMEKMTLKSKMGD